MKALTSLVTLIVLVAVLAIIIGVAYKVNSNIKALQDYVELRYTYLSSWLVQRLEVIYDNISKSYIVSIEPVKEIEYVVSICRDNISVIHVNNYTYSVSDTELSSIYTGYCRVAVISSDGAILWLNNYITRLISDVNTTNSINETSLLNDLLYDNRVYQPSGLEQYGLCSPEILEYRIGFGRIDVNFTPTICCYVGSRIVCSPSKIIALNQYVDDINDKSRKIYTNKQLISGNVRIVELYSITQPVVSLFTRIRDAITHVELANSTIGNIVGIYSYIPGTITNGTDYAWGKKSYVNEQILLFVNNTYNLANTSTRLLIVEQGALITAKRLAYVIDNPEINITLRFINMSSSNYNVMVKNIGLNLTLKRITSTGNYVFIVTVNNTTILERVLDKLRVELILDIPILTTPYYDLVLDRVWLFYCSDISSFPAIATTLLVKAKEKLSIQAHIMREHAYAKRIIRLRNNILLENNLKVKMVQEVIDGKVITRGERTQILVITMYDGVPQASIAEVQVTLYIPKIVAVIEQ